MNVDERLFMFAVFYFYSYNKLLNLVLHAKKQSCYYLNTGRSPWNKFCKFSLSDALKTLVNLQYQKSTING